MSFVQAFLDTRVPQVASQALTSVSGQVLFSGRTDSSPSPSFPVSGQLGAGLHSWRPLAEVAGG